MARFNVVIGRAEYLSVIDTVMNVPAKVDTGAYRSSIHAEKIKVTGSGQDRVLSFELLGHPVSPVKYPMKTSNFDEVVITNSFGHEEKRYEVKLRVKLGPKVFNSSFTLADRSNNFYPVLLGRKFLRGRYIVDVSQTHIDRTKLRKEFHIKGPIDEEDLE